MKKVLEKVGIIFIIITLAIITFVKAEENDGFNRIEEGNVITLTEAQKQELKKSKEQALKEQALKEQEAKEQEEKQQSKETANIALEQNIGISTIAATSDYKTTQLGIKDWSFYNFTIDGDETSVYFYTETGIEKYSVLTKAMETVVNYDNKQKDNFYARTEQNNIVYILVDSTTTTQTYHIQGYDLIQKKKVFDKKFNVNAEPDINLQYNFCVDKDQNFYFVTGKRIITSFDKNGNKLDSVESPIDMQIYIEQITPDGKTLVFETPIPQDDYQYESGYLAVENGKFLRYNGKEITTYKNVPFFLSVNFDYDLKFNKECTFAFDSAGHIFKYKFVYQDGFRRTWFSYVEDSYTNYYNEPYELRMLL